MNNKKEQEIPVRLLHLTSSLGVGGAETLLVDLVDRLRERNFDQTVLYFHPGPNVERIEQLGVETHHIKGRICMYDPWFFMRLIRCVRAINPDCMHTLLWAANFAGRIVARLLRIPMVAALHNNIDQNGKARILLDSITSSSNEAIIAVSEEVKQSYIQFIPSGRLPDIQVISNGIDAERCRTYNSQKNRIRSELGLDDSHYVIGSVGRFVPLKNYPRFLEQIAPLCATHENLRAVLMGVGPQEEYLKQKIKELNIEDYVQLVVNRRAIEYYHMFDCFALPSYKEGISIALLEAMSFGLPCVVGSHDGNHSVIEHEQTGFVVRPDQSFAEPIAKLMQQPVLAQQLGTAAYEAAQKQFSLTGMVEQYDRAFNSLLNRI